MKVFICTLVFLALLMASWARPNSFHRLQESNLERDVPGKAFTFNKFEGKRLGEIWTNCTTSSDMCSIVNVSISPDPPQKGKSVTATANFNLKEDITGGSLNINLKIDGFIPFKKTLDICDLAKSAGMSCPISQATKSVTVTESVPGVSGHIKGQVTATDQNGKRIACMNLDFKI